MRFIDADLLRKDLESCVNLHKDATFDPYDKGAYQAYMNAIELLDEQPTVVKGVRIYPGTIVVTTETEVLEETGRVVLEDDGIWCKSFYADEQPTQEIIHCENCKHYTAECGDEQFALGYCPFLQSHHVMSKGFCAWAERKGEADG